jgi:hypothetical protein
MERITTSRGKEGILIDGFKYRVDKKFQTSVLWRCTVRTCKARCKTDAGMEEITGQPNEHNHDPVSLFIIFVIIFF